MRLTNLRRTIGSFIVRVGLRVALGSRGKYESVTFHTPGDEEGATDAHI